MTRATLSGILTHLGALTDAEVRELEKLAENFPYCQTAHVLLAKALHDRGSMLAGQKLRRAATGAPDRRVLRRLLLTPAREDLPPTPAEPDTPLEAGTTQASPTGPPSLAVSEAGELVSAPPAATEEPAAAVDPLAKEAAGGPAEPDLAAATGEATPEAEEKEEAAAAGAPESAATPEQITGEALAGEPASVQAESSAAENSAADAGSERPATLGAPASPELIVPTAASDETTTEGEPAGPVIADFDLVPDTGPAIEELLLFETEPDAEGVPPGLALLTETIPVALLADVPALVPPLEAEAAVGYMVVSSRLGVELTAADLWPEAEQELLLPWLASLRPDARWTEHTARHLPPAPLEPRRPFDHQFALIDRFLREKPRLRTVDPTRPLPEKVPDLAQKSARADDGTLVSESMARILARQGKTTRAISMYEQLQVRFPEKAAIFAAQIAALRGNDA